MKAELEQQLVKDFPLLFSDYGGDMRTTCMTWGCECGDGWYDIIREACAKLEPLIQKWLEDHKDEGEDVLKNFRPRLSQVKEKYGTLRMYLSTSTDEMEDIVDVAEKKSETTCETCGKPGKLKGKWWVYTACFTHTKDEDKDNLEVVLDADAKHKKRKRRVKK